MLDVVPRNSERRHRKGHKTADSNKDPEFEPSPAIVFSSHANDHGEANQCGHQESSHEKIADSTEAATVKAAPKGDRIASGARTPARRFLKVAAEFRAQRKRVLEDPFHMLMQAGRPRQIEPKQLERIKLSFHGLDES